MGSAPLLYMPSEVRSDGQGALGTCRDAPRQLALTVVHTQQYSENDILSASAMRASLYAKQELVRTRQRDGANTLVKHDVLRCRQCYIKQRAWHLLHARGSVCCAPVLVAGTPACALLQPNSCAAASQAVLKAQHS